MLGIKYDMSETNDIICFCLIRQVNFCENSLLSAGRKARARGVYIQVGERHHFLWKAQHRTALTNSLKVEHAKPEAKASRICYDSCVKKKGTTSHFTVFHLICPQPFFFLFKTARYLEMHRPIHSEHLTR